MRSFKLTKKYQSTIPNDIRSFLDLKKGDRVTCKIENDKVILDLLHRWSERFSRSDCYGISQLDIYFPDRLKFGR